MPCQMCFNGSFNAFDLDFGNEAILTKKVKHWIPIIVLWVLQWGYIALKTGSKPASVEGEKVNNIHNPAVFPDVLYKHSHCILPVI